MFLDVGLRLLRISHCTNILAITNSLAASILELLGSDRSLNNFVSSASFTIMFSRPRWLKISDPTNSHAYSNCLAHQDLFWPSFGGLVPFNCPICWGNDSHASAPFWQVFHLSLTFHRCPRYRTSPLTRNVKLAFSSSSFIQDRYVWCGHGNVCMCVWVGGWVNVWMGESTLLSYSVRSTVIVRTQDPL